jgi:hypothetical protein
LKLVFSRVLAFSVFLEAAKRQQAPLHWKAKETKATPLKKRGGGGRQQQQQPKSCSTESSKLASFLFLLFSYFCDFLGEARHQQSSSLQ